MLLTDQKLRIGIVGGSISGCTAAVMLHRRGHQVTIMERSADVMHGRGAGIGTWASVVDSLIERDLIDHDFPTFKLDRLPHIGRTAAGDRYGRTAWVIPLKLAVLNWDDLFGNLRRRVPDAAYKNGHEVVDVRTLRDGQVAIRLADGNEMEYDLVIFADGQHSLGRNLLFPEAALTYRGYVHWGGVLPEAALSETAPLEGSLARLSYRLGNAVFFFVPGKGGLTAAGSRRVNWAMYVPVPKPELAAFMTSRDGRKAVATLRPGEMRLPLENRLKRLARECLPTYYADIIDASQDTSARAIYTTVLQAYHKGRVCLMGDAGSVSPPFTASGVFKGINNAVDLEKAVGAYFDVDEALKDWGAAQARTGQQVAALADQLEQALVFDIPDFSRMNEINMRAWWKQASRSPRSLFNPSASD